MSRAIHFDITHAVTLPVNLPSTTVSGAAKPIGVALAAIKALPVVSQEVWDTQHIPLSTQAELTQRWHQQQIAVDYRLKKYFEGKEFIPWGPNRSDEELKQEYIALTQLRGAAWYDVTAPELERAWREDFRPAAHLSHTLRYPNCVAFTYNHVHPHYNGNLVLAGGQRFLALEGPEKKTVRTFFHVLRDMGAALVVRLTPSIENHIERCYDYWTSHVKGDKLEIPRSLSNRPTVVDYLATDNWQDDSHLNVDLLLEMLLKARHIYDPKKGPMAVHCSAGVGRTGTFIAAYYLISEIDAQIARGEIPNVSVEFITAYLGLQRFHMVASAAQYINLYRVVEKYLAMRS